MTPESLLAEWPALLGIQQRLGLLDLLEVATVIGIEHIGNPTNMPARIILAPDRLAESKRRLCGRRRLEKKQEIASNSTAVNAFL